MKSKFAKIAESLRTLIEDEQIDSRLPSEQKLAKQFSCTTITIRKALDILDQEGMIQRIPSVGVFVKPKVHPSVRILWGDCHFTPGLEDRMFETVRGHFPEIDIEFVTESQEEDITEFDLFRVPATSTISYSEIAVPYPNKFIAKFNSDTFYQLPFDVHRINNYQFGLPFLFSPILLLLNKKMLEGSGIELSPYNLTFDSLHLIANWAENHGLELWSRYTAGIMLRALIFNCAGDSNALTDVDMSLLRKRLISFWPFLGGLTVSGDDSNEVKERCVLNAHYRQNSIYDMRSGNYQILTLPKEIGCKSVIAGDSLLLSGKAKHPESALRVAEHFLSPEIQRLIGDYKSGLPVMKSCAADSIDSREYRDDLFLCEAKKVYANNAQEQEFLLRLNSSLGRLFDKNSSFDKFFSWLEYEMEMAIEKQRQKNSGVNQRGVIHAA